MATTALIYALARPGHKGGTVQILLVGIAVTAVAGSINGFFTYIASSTELEPITFWSMCSLNRASWESLRAVGRFFVAGVVLLLSLSLQLDVRSLAECRTVNLGL